MSIAFTFPGQGSQSLGMLAGLAAAYPLVGQTFEEASGVLGYDLWALCQSGPEARLNATEQTQPAMLVAGVAAWRCWLQAGGAGADSGAGHSLGEFSALVAAGSLEFADAVRLVATRGRLMQAAVPEGRGGIAALLGPADGDVVDLCARVSAERAPEQVSAVNFNAPGQVVVAGHAGAVDRVVELAREAGARRAVRLPMSVPVHCPLMEPAATELGAALESVSFRAPRFEVLHNADLSAHADPAGIRAALVRQLVVPVRWGATVEQLAAGGASLLLELGPGRVLTGLARRIDRRLQAHCVHDPASLDAGLELLEGR